MKDDGEVCDGYKLSTINKLNGKELKIGDSHGMSSGNYDAELGVKEE